MIPEESKGTLKANNTSPRFETFTLPWQSYYFAVSSSSIVQLEYLVNLLTLYVVIYFFNDKSNLAEWIQFLVGK